MRHYSEIRIPDWALSNNTEFGDISPHLQSDLNVSNTRLEVGADTVEYWYDLKKFEEDKIMPANRAAHSAVNCGLIEVGKGQYWRLSNRNKTGPFSMQDLCHNLIIHNLSINEADFGFG